MGESIPREAEAYYNRGIEAGRLFRSHGLIEFARTQEIILLPDLERRWADPAEREHLLEAARAVEREPTLPGLPPHLLAVAAKRG
jgi:hypothetical protein